MTRQLTVASAVILTLLLVGGCPLDKSPVDVTAPIGSPDINVDIDNTANNDNTADNTSSDANTVDNTNDNDNTVDNGDNDDNPAPPEENEAPVAHDESVTVQFNTPRALTLSAADPDNGPEALTYEIVENPAHGTLAGDLPDVTYTPDTDYCGSDSFTFKAFDGALYSETATVSITVGPCGCGDTDPATLVTSPSAPNPVPARIAGGNTAPQCDCGSGEFAGDPDLLPRTTPSNDDTWGQFTTTFDLPAGYTNPRIELKVRADDGAQIFLNDTLVTQVDLLSGVTHDVTIDDAQLFREGVNTLRFYVVNTQTGYFGEPTPHGGAGDCMYVEYRAEVTYDSGNDPVVDNFDDGVIDSSLWASGGAKRGWRLPADPGDLGNWSHSETEEQASDGYARLRVWGPTSGNTYGAESWIRTVYNFNDGNRYTINFTWEASVNDSAYNYYYIQVTDGYIRADGDVHWPQEDLPPGTTNLLSHTYSGNDYPGKAYPGGHPRSTWSIVIDPAGEAQLYDGADGTGTLLREEALTPASAWYIRLLVSDATSAGFPAGDIALNLYSFSARAGS